MSVSAQVVGPGTRPSLDYNERRHEATGVTSQDLEVIWKWNGSVPETVDGRVHDLIAQRVHLHPDKQAVCAWDGNWSYRQLDDLSTSLAHGLVGMGVGPDVVVPLCFPKSKWTPIAMLAVMKAGGASVALETTLPHDRLHGIVQQLKPTVMLSSSLTTELARRLTTQTVVVVDEATFAPGFTSTSLPQVQPSSRLYIVFTSGSTGTPKGTILTHSNICSLIHHQQAVSGYSDSSRVYDFAKYSFDVAWSNFIHTLTAGGCLCIPSQQEALSNLVGSIKAYNANCINITPSVGGMIRPSELNGILKHVIFAGEALPCDLAWEWARHSTVLNIYGPAECGVGSTVAFIDNDVVNMGSSTVSIGHGVGLCTWIVDPDCSDRLVPVGAVGELILEGPIVGAGYLGDAEKTAAAFINPPEWLVAGPPGQTRRPGPLYKTGDLVRYGPDGQLTFLGRKDLQVKINGQRVELGDIEYHVRTNVADVADVADVQVAAELIIPRDSSKPVLVAFVQISRSASSKSRDELEQELNKVVDGLNGRLASHLPAYMIPSAYIPLDVFPTNANGKLDRRKLKEIGHVSSIQEILGRGLLLVNKGNLTTAMEIRLQGLWLSVLELKVDSLGAEDSFLRLGGDSIAAMKLAAVAREHSLSLNVADIFNYPVLSDMAAVITEVPKVPKDNCLIKPFELLKKDSDVALVRRLAAGVCGVEAVDIEDIFPCTPLQEGLMALTAKHPGDYVSRHVFQLQPTVDMKRLERAWERVVATTPILRTRIIDINQQGLVQVIINQPTPWVAQEEGMSFSKYEQADGSLKMGLGAPLVRFALFKEQPYGARRFFVWTMHHALYDGWSKPLLLERLSQAYDGQDTLEGSPQFQGFVKHILAMQEDEAAKLWSTQFSDFDAQIFPILPSPGHTPRPDTLVKHVISRLQWPKTIGVTASTALRAAWSIITSAYTDVNDTVFGITVSGRQAAVPGVDRMTGPTIATVPLRVVLNKEKTVEELLLQVQKQVVDMTAFEQTGLQRIRRVCPEAERACDFRTLLIIQPAADEREKAIYGGLFLPIVGSEQEIELDDGIEEFRTYPLSLECHVQDQGVVLLARFDSAVLDKKQVFIMMRQLEGVVRQLCDSGSAQMKLGDLVLVGHEDLQEIWRWNPAVPDTADGVVHDLISATTRQQPEAQAVCAWDGNWTYRELDELSTRLAHLLMEVGVGPNVIVPLCIEKSKWMPVAMMAVMKAGGASVALDDAQPEDRLRTIIQQIELAVILTSSENHDLTCRLINPSPHKTEVKVVVISQEQLANLPPVTRLTSTALPVLSQANKLYIIFTSGSTGTPKGVVVTHENITSAIRHQRETLGFSTGSRIYDFASYMFDVVWCNLLQGLSAGGCICIPCKHDRRNDPLGAMIPLAL